MVLFLLYCSFRFSWYSLFFIFIQIIFPLFSVYIFYNSTALAAISFCSFIYLPHFVYFFIDPHDLPFFFSFKAFYVGLFAQFSFHHYMLYKSFFRRRYGFLFLVHWFDPHGESFPAFKSTSVHRSIPFIKDGIQLVHFDFISKVFQSAYILMILLVSFGSGPLSFSGYDFSFSTLEYPFLSQVNSYAYTEHNQKSYTKIFCILWK